jgi:hypothetical protein
MNATTMFGYKMSQSLKKYQLQSKQIKSMLIWVPSASRMPSGYWRLELIEGFIVIGRLR